MGFFIDNFRLSKRFCDQSTLFLTDIHIILSIREVPPSLNVIISIFFLNRKNAIMTFYFQSSLLLNVIIQMIRLSHISLWNTMGKVAQILFILTSHCDFHFKHLNISFSENKLIVDLNSNCHDCSIQKNR